MNQKTIIFFTTNPLFIAIKKFFDNILFSIKKDFKFLLVLFFTFLVTLFISFIDVSGGQTVMTLSLSDYEIGQISDRTLIAEKDLSPTVENPVSITKGEKLLRKGFPISEVDYQKLKKIAEAPSYIDYERFVQSVFFFLLLFLFAYFLFSKILLGKLIQIKEVVFLSVLFVIIYALTVMGSKIPPFDSMLSLPIIIPSALVAILVSVLFGYLDSIYFSLIVTFCIFYETGFQPIPGLFALCSCFTAAKIVKNMDKRIQIVFASLELAITNTIYLVLLYIIFRGSVEKIALFDILGIAFNGFISGILALGFLTPLESLLNTASVFRLMDLSDLNSPLMKKMLLTAPGTYNHSMLVATLAENAAHAIGANALLARVGAYYHDIGKLEQPEYFVENQREGNKHDEINPRLSVSVIRRHVKKGKEKAQQMRFPQEVIDIISQHHGNSVIGYFYAEAKKLDENVSPEEFSYQEDPPSSRESAIVMLADTVEASTRTLERPSVSRLEKFIRQRIMEKYEHHQLDKSALTFNDLDTILDSFVKILGGYYHSRIEYPNQKDPDEVDAQDNSGEKTEDK